MAQVPSQGAHLLPLLLTLMASPAAMAQNALPDVFFEDVSADQAQLNKALAGVETKEHRFYPLEGVSPIEVGQDKGISTIQEAIAQAPNGAVITVEQGIYIENLDFLGKSLVIIALDGPEKTTLDGRQCQQGLQRCATITLDAKNAPGTWIEGFSIIGGKGHSLDSYRPLLQAPWSTQDPKKQGVTPKMGGAIFLQGTRATLAGCIIKGGLANYGGGIAVLGETPLAVSQWQQALRSARRGAALNAPPASNKQKIGTQLDLISTQVVDNMAYYAGGGIYVDSAMLTVTDGRISGNEANQGGGLAAVRAQVFTTEVEFLKDRAQVAGGAIHLRHQSQLVAVEAALVEGWANRGALLFTDESTATFETSWLAYPRGGSAFHNTDSALLALYDLTIWSEGDALFKGEPQGQLTTMALKTEPPNFVDLEGDRHWHHDDLGAWRNGDPSAQPTIQVSENTVEVVDDLSHAEPEFDAWADIEEGWSDGELTD